jgi:hypothetical protein
LVGHALFGVDRAFNNTASTGMGSAGLGGKARHAADNNNIDALASYTVSGWFKTQSVALQGFARIVDNYVGPDGFVVPGGNVAGELRSSVDGWDGDQADMAGYGDINKWVFFAVTYAGATGEMKFYKGYRNNAEAGGSAMVALLGTLTPTQGSVNQEPYIFTIGNHNTTTTYNRPFDGFLDNIRVHGAASGAAGALSLNDLEALRAGDVLIPEPTSLALAWVGALGVMRIGRRRRR